MWPPRRRVPRPNLVGIEQVQFPDQLPTLELVQTAHKIPVDVIGMVFVLRERAVSKYLPDTYFPQLAGQDFQVVDQSRSPTRIPGGVLPWISRSQDEHRAPQFLKRHLVIARRQQAICFKGRNHCHTCRPRYLDTLAVLDKNVKHDYRASMSAHEGTRFRA